LLLVKPLKRNTTGRNVEKLVLRTERHRNRNVIRGGARLTVTIGFSFHIVCDIKSSIIF
jgi:hypothetical protein